MAITTNREYLQATLGKFGLSADDVELIVVDNPLLEGYLDPALCKQAMYNSMSNILPTADVSEGSMSMTWDIAKLRLWYFGLCNELGLPNVLKPQIRNRSNYW